jgi:phosphate:Na+ symporter
MKDLPLLKEEIAEMSHLSLKMLQLTHRAFMEHDTDLITLALEEESKLNDAEKTITTELVEFGRSCARKDERQKTAAYTDIVGDLEMIGDYCKDILERVQIKIEEKLLFSEEAVKEYNDLYALSEKALEEAVNALDQDKPGLVKEVLANQQHIDSLVDELRRRHNQRLIDGVCIPIACNMFLNMLDFTAAIYYHTKKIAKNLSRMKK